MDNSSQDAAASHHRHRRGLPGGERLYTIGEMARMYNVTLRALRFYEDRGLINPFRQGSSRFYDNAARLRFETILKGKQLGFTLGQISAMLPPEGEQSDLHLEESQILKQISQLERKRSDLDAAIAELRKTQSVLSQRSRGSENSAASAA